MAEPKTRPTKASVEKFLAAVKPESRAEECRVVAKMMKKAAKADAVMWGPNIVGFGTYPLTYANGSTLDWPVLAFSPRKTALTLYLMPDSAERKALLAKLGKHKTGKVCLYLSKLADVDLVVLEKLITASVAAVQKRHK